MKNISNKLKLIYYWFLNWDSYVEIIPKSQIHSDRTFKYSMELHGIITSYFGLSKGEGVS